MTKTSDAIFKATKILLDSGLDVTIAKQFPGRQLLIMPSGITFDQFYDGLTPEQRNKLTQLNCETDNKKDFTFT